MSDVSLAAVSTARVTPTVSQPTRIDWLSWGEQLAVHEAPMIEAAANFGLTLAEGAIPGGMIIKMFVGEKAVDQLIEQGFKVLDQTLRALPPIEIGADHPIAQYAANMFNNTAPKLAAALGPKLDELIRAGLGKVGVSV